MSAAAVRRARADLGLAGFSAGLELKRRLLRPESPGIQAVWA